MKRTLFIIGFLAAMALCSNSLQAQDLRDRIGNSVGKVENSGTVRDRIGNSVGKIDSDGTIRDRIGNSIGKIDSDGTIRDRIGNSIGSAKGVDKKQAAVFFFFNKFDQ